MTLLPGSLTILSLGLALLLAFSATLHLALRIPSRVRLEETLRRWGRERHLLALLESRSDLSLLAAALRTACVIALALVVLRMCAEGLEAQWHLQYLATFGIALGVVLICGVAIPAAWAEHAGESLVVGLLPSMLLVRRIFSPLIFLMQLFDPPIRRLAGVPADTEVDDAARHELEILQVVSDGEKAGVVDEEEKQMIESIIDLRDAHVAEIMTPRTEIEAVPRSANLAEIKALIRRVGHSRIPVYDETIDNVMGVLYAKDLLHIDDEGPFEAPAVMRPATFIPETKNLRELLHEFQGKKVHMAIVLDEYGGTAGLVTIEDILEELVGEIEDEYDTEEPEPMTRVDDNTADVDARMRIDELNAELEVALPEDGDFETIGGFVFSTLGRIPAAGEALQLDAIRIEVLEAEPRRIKRLRLQIARPAEPAGGGE